MTKITFDGGRSVLLRSAAGIVPGDRIDLRLTASVNNIVFFNYFDQTLSLSRGGELLAFGAMLTRHNSAQIPDFTPEGLSISDGDAGGCLISSSICQGFPRGLRVQIDGGETQIPGGGVGSVGGYTISLPVMYDLRDLGSCDFTSPTDLFGARN